MSFITTYTGKQIDPANPIVSNICIEDIAHALSNTCRFNGHCREFYSVAQHSVLVCGIAPNNVALMALLHDATEAYIADITSPLKPHLSNYAELEQAWWDAIALRFELTDAFNQPLIIDKQVKEADLIALATEKRDLLNHQHHWSMLDGISPSRRKIIPLEPEKAKNQFLWAYRVITSEAA